MFAIALLMLAGTFASMDAARAQSSCKVCADQQKACMKNTSERDEITMNHHRASGSCLGMISVQMRSVFVARENRFILFRIMP
jgi:hypothetical protein